MTTHEYAITAASTHRTLAESYAEQAREATDKDASIIASMQERFHAGAPEALRDLVRRMEGEGDL